LSDRENVANFHFGIPHRHDTGRDDIQLLYDNFFYQTSAWDNISTVGGLNFLNTAMSPAGTNPNGSGYYNTFLSNFGLGLPTAQYPQYTSLCDFENLLVLAGAPPCASTGASPIPYFDAYQVNATFGQSALGSPNILKQYYFPSTNLNRPFQSGYSPYQVSDTDNNGTVVKLQYQHNMGANAFLRLYGYSFYSDWTQNDPNYSYIPFAVAAATSGDYEVNAHTRGINAEFADQLNEQHLLTVIGSYTTATMLRNNNAQYTFAPNTTPIATLGSGNTCYDAYTNQQGSQFIDPGYTTIDPVTHKPVSSVSPGQPVSCLSALAGAPIAAVEAGSCPTSSAPFTCLQTPAGLPGGATWSLTQNLGADANINTVGPKFWNAAVQDEWKPGDRWDINAGVRFESYGYQLGNVASQEQAFWFNQINTTACVDPQGLQQASVTDQTPGISRSQSASGYPSYITTAPGAACPVDISTGHQLYHPGQQGIPLLSLGQTGTITHDTASPRIGFTYSMSPNKVLRFSFGRYTQPTPTAFEQVLTYGDGYQMATNLYDSHYYNIGLASDVHDNPIQFSNNADMSYEQRLNGTDWSFKISPFYRHTVNQSVEVSLPGGLAGAFNSGTQQSTGVELAIQKGDPSVNGWSGQLSYTYTQARLKYALIDGTNIVSTMLNSLKPLLSLEKINGGSPCYIGGAGQATCTPGTAGEITNPYYNDTITQAQLNAQFPLSAYYPTYANIFPDGLQSGDGSTAIPPNVFAGFATWKHDKLQATLTANLWQGYAYGAPTDIAGLDPRSCAANQGDTGIVATSLNADYQTCTSSIAIPNPYTGQFNNIAQFRDPWDFNLGMAFGYDLSPRIHATVQLANVLNRCFGGSAEPWTAAFKPNAYVCAYGYNTTFIGVTPGAGYFYGTGGHDPVNGTTGYPKLFDQAYAPSPNQIASPFQAYFQVQVRL
jgi:hypothetical protein